MKQQTLIIDPEFKAQIPPLTEDERKQLEENPSLSGTTPLWTGTTAMKFCKTIQKFPLPFIL